MAAEVSVCAATDVAVLAESLDVAVAVLSLLQAMKAAQQIKKKFFMMEL